VEKIRKLQESKARDQ
jgi:hypothetical protein